MRLDDALDTLEVSWQQHAPKATIAESTFGRGRNTVRATDGTP
jgi:hypothetical protein